MEIRKLTVEDYEAAVCLYRQLDVLHTENRPDYFAVRQDVFPRDAYMQVIAEKECLMLGCFSDEELIATVRASLWKDNGIVPGISFVCLDNIIVKQEFRHRGIARMLFDRVEQWAAELGATRLELHVWNFNKNAMAFYRSMGMSPQRHVLEKTIVRKY